MTGSCETAYFAGTDVMQITFIFILILFVDSVNRVYRVQIELSGSDDQGRGGQVNPPLASNATLTF